MSPPHMECFLLLLIWDMCPAPPHVECVLLYLLLLTDQVGDRGQGNDKGIEISVA